MNLYIHREGEQFGPYSLEEAHAYMASGQLLAHDLAWHDGAAGWEPLEQVLATPALAMSEPAVQLAEEPAEAEPEPAPVAASTTPAWVPPRRDSRTPARSTATARLVAPSNSPTRVGSVAPAAASAPAAKEKSRRRRGRSTSVSPMRRIGLRNMMTGAVLFVVGAGATIAGFTLAHGRGGIFVVFWGAILFGLVRFFLGLSQLFKG